MRRAYSIVRRLARSVRVALRAPDHIRFEFTGDTQQRELEGWVSAGGMRLPVYRYYRYGVKPGWQYFGPLSAMNDLRERGVLTAVDTSFLERAKGHRTLACSLEECREVLQKYIDAYPELFISTVIPDLGKRLLKPSRAEVEREIDNEARRHRSLLQSLTSKGLLQRGGTLRVLEIGYTSGGTSVIGFQRCGCEAHGLDYFFDGAIPQGTRHDYIRDVSGSTVQYHVGDITQQTGLADGSFDIVYSSAVIEHLSDLDGAFREIWRILKPGGVSVHGYDPYFHPAGAHSLGIADSPWAHVRMPRMAHLAYIRALRPFEAEAATKWLQAALDRRHTMSAVQRALLEAGFSIKVWRNGYINRRLLNDLSGHILRDCVRTVRGLSLEDLITRNIYFVAQKTDLDLGHEFVAPRFPDQARDLGAAALELPGGGWE